MPAKEFDLDEIKAAHSKVKSGADFPNYVQELINFGVTGYTSYVADGNTVYTGEENYQLKSGPKYTPLNVADKSKKEEFIADLKAHQQGKTDYPQFCSDCADAGIEKWILDFSAMTCTYYDKAGNVVLTEQIPAP